MDCTSVSIYHSRNIKMEKNMFSLVINGQALQPKCVKPLGNSPSHITTLVQVLALPFSIQLLSKVPGKMAEEGPNLKPDQSF